MDKKDAIYTVTLAVSLFSLSLLLFSQGITNLSVSIRDENPFAVSVPTLFSMNHVLIMLFFTALASHSLTILGRDFFFPKESLNPTERGKGVKTSISSSEAQKASQKAQFQVPASKSSLADTQALAPMPGASPLSSSELSSPPSPILRTSNPPTPETVSETSRFAAKSTRFQSEPPKTRRGKSGELGSSILEKPNPSNPDFDKLEHKKKVALEILQGDEKTLFAIISEKEEILQSELVLESGFSKVKVSRVLQKLERKSLIKRKPFGNTNKVMLAK